MFSPTDQQGLPASDDLCSQRLGLGNLNSLGIDVVNGIDALGESKAVTKGFIEGDEKVRCVDDVA